jgi:hypothetical protein
MAVLTGKELGLERIAREIQILLINNLNTALDVEDAKWTTLDQELNEALLIPYVKCTSDHVETKNFYVGHKPSLIEAPVEYPNVSVMAYQNVPSRDQGDQYEGNTITAFIESMVIEGPYPQEPDGAFNREAEDVVNRKVQRMLEAIHNVIVSNRTLGGIVFEITGPPTVIVTECLRRREGPGSGPDYYWQMVRLEYTVNKISAY